MSKGAIFTIYVISLVLCLQTALVWSQYFSFAPLGPDSGTYLTVARRISQGGVPYRDFPLWYTPLAMYYFALIETFAPSWALPAAHRVGILLIEILCGLLIYRLCSRSSNQRALALAVTSYFLLSCSRLEGGFIVLEPVVLLFQLLVALMLCQTAPRSVHVVIAGLCCGLAALSKQYGIVIAIPALSAIAFHIHTRVLSIRHLIQFIVAFSLVGLAFLALFAPASPDAALHMLDRLRGSGYHSVPFKGGILLGFLIAFAPFLPVTLLLIAGTPRETQVISWFSFVWLGCAAISLTVRQFLHYFLLVMPPLALLLFLTTQRLASFPRFWREIFPVTVLGVTAYALFVFAPVQPWDHLDAKRQILAQQVETLRQFLPAGSPALVFANPELAYLAQLEPAAPSTIGYGFLHSHPTPVLIEALEQSKTVIIDPADTPYMHEIDARLTESGSDIYRRLANRGFTMRSSAGAVIEVWQRADAPYATRGIEAPRND